ncbi:MOSC domain-containing protein [Rhodopseudomonas boonkerdii]|uniref:MOSC domain-containing protein n=1 Tax=Rhodopseudomonas boonkerdii TaxID=475937 RepID=UPI001E5D0419|nr:MOSC domain-containing protein [Rhodopseudomonas boonkerdii]UGV26037.1 MOSC domain-containing protein [Rhodopseudomonas boonkerdii]
MRVELSGRVVAVCVRRGHHFSKTPALSIRLLSGLGVEGDGHMGATVQHRYDRRRDPCRPNLRQVHLVPSELFDELRGKGFSIAPGDLGENITTSGVDLAAFPTATRLHLGASAVIELTGLREPCTLMDRFRQGLKAATLNRDAGGGLIYKAGVMAVVLAGGEVAPGDAIRIEMPTDTSKPLRPV